MRSPQMLTRALTRSGFVETAIRQADAEGTRMVMSLVPEKQYRREKILVINMKTQKPGFQTGATVKLSLRKRGNNNNNNVQAKPVVPEAAHAWAISANVDDDDGELVDEDMLLDGDVDGVPGVLEADACRTRKKACKNCSCGRAEEEAGLTRVKINLNDPGSMPKSSCGSCYLGDAFRCPTCPYMGMPAFQPGEKIQLAGALLADDDIAAY